MGMPDQVAAQLERANQIHNELYGTKEPEAEPQAVATGTPESQPAVEEPNTEVQPQPQPAAPAAPEATPAKTEDFEQKYRTLQGVFNAESGRWQAEKKIFEERLRALEHAKTEAPALAAAQPKASSITDADIETYGPELIDVIGRRAAEMAEQIVAKRMGELKPELDKTRQQVSDVSQAVHLTKEERFYEAVAKAVPDWEKINTDQRWLDWLAEVDPLSGVPRQRYLDNAQAQLNDGHVATLFNAFKDAAGLNKPAADLPKPNLSPQPRTVGNASAPTHREPETGVRRTELAAHYRRASTDVTYRTGPEHKAMEERIAKAMATGSIIEA